MSPTQRRTRCVVLMPRECRASERGRELQSLLDEQGWMTHETQDPLPAMAELCLLDRLQASRRSWGLAPVEGLALVVCDPRWSELPDMLSAARRYVPKAQLLAYENGTLQRIDMEPVPRPVARPARQESEDPEPANREAPTIETPLISNEEIAMLLEADQKDSPE